MDALSFSRGYDLLDLCWINKNTHTHTHEGSGDENGTGGEFKNRTDVAKVLCFAVSQMQPLSYSL